MELEGLDVVVVLCVVVEGVVVDDGCLVVDALLLLIVAMVDPSPDSLSSGIGTIVFPYSSRFR